MRVFNFLDTQIPNACADPVFDSMPTNAPKSAQNKKIRIFHPSDSDAANKSVAFIKASAGFPPAAITQPDKMPKNSDTITSLVTNASVMVNKGGIIPHMPKCSIKLLLTFFHLLQIVKLV